MIVASSVEALTSQLAEEPKGKPQCQRQLDVLKVELTNMSEEKARRKHQFAGVVASFEAHQRNLESRVLFRQALMGGQETALKERVELKEKERLQAASRELEHVKLYNLLSLQTLATIRPSYHSECAAVGFVPICKNAVGWIKESRTLPAPLDGSAPLTETLLLQAMSELPDGTCRAMETCYQCFRVCPGLPSLHLSPPLSSSLLLSPPIVSLSNASKSCALVFISCVSCRVFSHGGGGEEVEPPYLARV